MQRKSLSLQKNSKELDHYAKKISSGRYFRGISISYIKEMLRQSELVSLNSDEYLFRKDQINFPEFVVLLEGSLLLKSDEQFIMRLNNPGDLVGEFSVFADKSRNFTDVLSERQSKVIIFPYSMFKAADDDTKVSVAYLVYSRILAEKLKHVTAESILKNNLRSQKVSYTAIGIMDTDKISSSLISSTLKKIWHNANIFLIESFQNADSEQFKNNLDLIIVDPQNISDNKSKNNSINKISDIRNSFSGPIFVISTFCRKEDNRKILSGLGVTDFLTKPFSKFDLQHKLTKFKNEHFRQKELEQILIEAETDKLTGLANRRRLDKFLDALVTIFPEEKKSFSLIIADVDNFKYYNDTHGHQMGDIALVSIASILKNRIRLGDLAVRFGGEEFVVILPNCSKKNAVLIGNELRKAISDEKFQFQEHQPLGKLTCTFGIATFPDDAETKENLLKRADECLYKGKENGRNKVIAA